MRGIKLRLGILTERCAVQQRGGRDAGERVPPEAVGTGVRRRLEDGRAHQGRRRQTGLVALRNNVEQIPSL